ncbi:hypothetical protein C8Q75DRAFT_805362 [Abortiporus biennis]|nr:hypothetical protein C8Q75DRAFT_805362 [Abortiporus biennis]
MFYPDNAHRTTRLQQLVDSMANMQTDIKHSAKEMDKWNAKIRPIINMLLKERCINSIDKLIAKSLAKMTAEERKQFEGLIEVAKKSKAGFNWTYFAAGLLILPEGAVLSRMAQSFKSAQGTISMAAKAAAQFEKAAIEAENIVVTHQLFLFLYLSSSLHLNSSITPILSGTSKAAGPAAAEAKAAGHLMGRVATALKVLGAVGFVITAIVGVVEAIQGAQQKDQLIKAIHGC